MSDIQDLKFLKTAINLIDYEAISYIEAKHLSIVGAKNCSLNLSKHTEDCFAKTLIPSSIDIDEPCALKGTGNGNCLYNAASIILCGEKSLATSLHTLTASELFIPGDKYLQHPVLWSVVKNPSFLSKHTNDAKAMIFPTNTSGKNHGINFSDQLHDIALSTCNDKEWSGFIHLMALSPVLQIPIHSVYPDVNQAIRPLFNTVLHPVHTSKTTLGHTSSMHILWSREGSFNNRAVAPYEPTHFMPVITRQLSVGTPPPPCGGARG
jgi:hypothetical protein